MPRKKIILSLDTGIDDTLRNVPGVVDMSSAPTQPSDAGTSSGENASVGAEPDASSPIRPAATCASAKRTLRPARKVAACATRSPPPDHALAGRFDVCLR